MTVLAWINEQTNICENTTLDPRPASEVIVPGYLMLDLEQTPSARWEWDETTQEWIIVQENTGQGGIGDEYIDGVLITPKLVATADQPATTGTQTL